MDKLHVHGHSRCSCAYDPYKNRFMLHINSQACEQTNSKFGPQLQKVLYKMGQVSFLFHFRHFFWLDQLVTDGYEL
jgi:hypothetical protein